jgi:hypothetical protein
MFFLFSAFQYYVALLAMFLFLLGKELEKDLKRSQGYYIQIQILLWEKFKRDLMHRIITSHTCDEKCPVGTPVQTPPMLP